MLPFSPYGLAALGGAAADVGGPAPGGGGVDGDDSLGSGESEAPAAEGDEPPNAPLPPYLLDLLKAAAEAGAVGPAAAPGAWGGEEEAAEGGAGGRAHIVGRELCGAIQAP